MKSLNYLKNLNIFVTCLKAISFGIKVTIIHTIGFIIGTSEIFWIMIKQRFLGQGLPNYGIVEQNQLHRGGQPDANGLNQLEKKGIKTVIHLRARKLKKYKGKLKRFFIPFNPYQPRDKVVIEFLKVIGNQEHHPVFVHCFFLLQ